MFIRPVAGLRLPPAILVVAKKASGATPVYPAVLGQLMRVALMVSEPAPGCGRLLGVSSIVAAFSVTSV